MSNRVEGPTTADGLIARATESVHARHVVALYLEIGDEAVAADVASASARALRRLPPRGPLRRQKDRRLLKAVRVIVDELSDEHLSKRSLRWSLEEAEWRARLGAR